MIVGAILLAAGSARRMGDDKLRMDLGGRPLIAHVLETLMRPAVDSILAAVAPGPSIAPLLEGRAMLVEVADHAEGMGRSLAAAVAAIPAHWDAVLVALADMPFVRGDTIDRLVEHASPDAVVRPRHAGRPGNPVLWGRSHFPALAELRGDEGGRSLLGDRVPLLIDCGDPGILFDVDTPEALAEARARLRG
ncbi:MAG: nucleotidyltransferase family protein [Pseudomonadota bacterium]